MEKEFLRSLSALDLAAIYFSGGIPWKWLLFLFRPPLGAVLPDLCAPRPATDRGPEAEEGKGSVQCACWLCARTGSDGDCQALPLHLVWRLLLVYSVTYLVRESPQLSFPTPARGRRPLLFQRRPSGLSPCRPGFLPIISFRRIVRLRTSRIIEFYLLVNCFCVFRYRYFSPFPPSILTGGSRSGGFVS